MQAFSRQHNPTLLAFKEQAGRALAANPTLIRLNSLNPMKAVSHSLDLPRRHLALWIEMSQALAQAEQRRHAARSLTLTGGLSP